MITRIWRGRTRADRSEEYRAYLETTGIRDLEQTEGNLGVTVAERTEDGQTEFLFISFWTDLEAIRSFAGDEIDRARYYPRDPDFLLEMTPKVEHHLVTHRTAKPD